MTKRKNLFKNISIFLCLVPMLVLSLFCLGLNNQVLSVSAADQSFPNYTFFSSDINLCASSIDNNDGDHDVTTFINVNFSFGINDNIFSWRVYGTLARPELTAVRTFDASLETHNNLAEYWFELPTLENTRYYFPCRVTLKAPNVFPSSDIVKVVLSSTGILEGSDGYCTNTITYYDINDNFVEFAFMRYAPNYGKSTDVFRPFDLENRTYYLTLAQFNDGTIYENGYTNGYNDGLTDGKDIGYTDGYNAGVDIGYGNGYNDGVEHGGNYTFLGLIGAVIDAPVSAFTSLLNFDILGVNILGFISGLLTLALIIFIIKLCLGGK